ncbi:MULTISPECIES: DUF4278 domain-containing protein [Calothrix]|uniref:DUF4278 domain-containing protein n=2 Tax=Calothrix TaxID=1186 RepID=A0ABR8A2X3_9CYAN|nr:MULTISPECIES: DUF4278 domain-containing protein [Calothrix]MBD2194292.1 DUF4278 domain-containing protein [Calothrix parietina FACHB-288]MBD2229586.1 DUF4278 domain-containing protein [Calothrix anomala FACHB-343]
MALCFFILLCACLITSYFLFKKSNNEVSHLLAVFAAISLILGLIFAPWQVLLLLLIAVLISTSYEYYNSKVVSLETESPQPEVITSEEDCHQLIYRGASYRVNSAVNLDEEKIQPVTHKLCFRGGNYTVCIDPKVQSDEEKIQPVTYKLSFRGRSYSVNKTAR